MITIWDEILGLDWGKVRSTSSRLEIKWGKLIDFLGVYKNGDGSLSTIFGQCDSDNEDVYGNEKYDDELMIIMMIMVC